mmetsp:Transcript_162221/g.515424  ORF Transcript_162221/g.515424 Transcript_162221/m.515424 type:complete len:103 (+) Transcript_162221:192-500(+)
MAWQLNGRGKGGGTGACIPTGIHRRRTREHLVVRVFAGGPDADPSDVLQGCNSEPDPTLMATLSVPSDVLPRWHSEPDPKLVAMCWCLLTYCLAAIPNPTRS